jgi:PEGA domain-containing protein/curli production assembly/transport component CsgG
MKKAFLLLVCLTQLLFAQKNGDAVRIAVLDFGTSGGLSEMEAVTLTNRLRSMLVKTNSFVVLERGKMDEILVEQGFQQTGCTTTECAVEVGKLLNVQKMVSGTIGKIGKTWTMDISLIDIQTSHIEKSFFQDYKGEIDGLLNEMESVAVQIANIAAKKEATKPGEKKMFSLSVLSTPTDATIFINGKYAGKTPFESKSKEGLNLEIKLQKENYSDWLRTVAVSKDINLNANLELSESYKEDLANKAKEQRQSKVTQTDEGSGSTWWWIGGGVVVAGGAAVAILLSSDEGSGDEPEPTFPTPPLRP